MRVLFLTHFFPPEVGAPQPRILETAINLQATGHEVVVLTTFPNYPSGVVPEPYRGKLHMREKIEGVRVLRAWSHTTPNKGFIRRTLSHLSFALTALPAVRKLPWRPDVISVDMHPLFLCMTAAVLGRIWRIPYVLNAGDLIPDQAVAYGVMKNPVAIRLSSSMANLAIGQAERIVPFTRGIRDTLIERGVQAEDLDLIYYGANVDLFQSPNGHRDLAVQLPSLEGRFVVTYAGTHGLPHGLEVIVQAAEILRDATDIHFLLVGDGSKKAELIADARRRNLSNITFLDPIERDALSHLYQRSDACLVTLKRSEWLRKHALSSKVFDAMAAGRPIIVAAEGETAEFVARAHAGICVPPESPKDLADAICALKSNPQLRTQLGCQGRQFINNDLSREHQSRHYERTLQKAIASHKSRQRRGFQGNGRIAI